PGVERVEDRRTVAERRERLVGYPLAHWLAVVPVAVGARQVAAAYQHAGVETRLDRARQREHERAHRISHGAETGRIDFRPRGEIRNRLPDVGHHQPAHALAELSRL